jgi:putative DNA methylase
MPADQTFIETQFPVSKLSKESYKERSAKDSQTLTGLGKWWGRKPLIMVRAAILGLLMPASDNPKKDREIFLKILTMDEAGLRLRKSKSIPLREIYAHLTPAERAEWFIQPSAGQLSTDYADNFGVNLRISAQSADQSGFKLRKFADIKLRKGLSREDRESLQMLVFSRLHYDEKLDYCDRPEQMAGPSPQAWEDINAHLGTDAANLPALVRQLGINRFGHVPRVGDAFCGGGSMPFEAARIGCVAYGSDLNPVAALLTWGALHIVGGGESVARQVREAQELVFAAVDRQITAWGIEHNAIGWRADAYLYCTEARCPECGWQVPLAPSWVIGEKTKIVAKLVPAPKENRFAIDIHQDVAAAEMLAAKQAGTVGDSRLKCPHCLSSSPISIVRRELRLWENDDVTPRPDDVFQERLYCIRWVLPKLVDLLIEEQRLRKITRETLSDTGSAVELGSITPSPNGGGLGWGRLKRGVATDSTPLTPTPLPKGEGLLALNSTALPWGGGVNSADPAPMGEGVDSTAAPPAGSAAKIPSPNGGGLG